MSVTILHNKEFYLNLIMLKSDLKTHLLEITPLLIKILPGNLIKQVLDMIFFLSVIIKDGSTSL